MNGNECIYVDYDSQMNWKWRQMQMDQEDSKNIWDEKNIPSDLWNLLFSYQGISSSQIMEVYDRENHQYNVKRTPAIFQLVLSRNIGRSILSLGGRSTE